jgi:hypothetical protein
MASRSTAPILPARRSPLATGITEETEMKNSRDTKAERAEPSPAAEAAKILKDVKIKSGVRAGFVRPPCKLCGLVLSI